MRVELVGGPCDGQVVDVDERAFEVRVMPPSVLSLARDVERPRTLDRTMVCRYQRVAVDVPRAYFVP